MSKKESRTLPGSQKGHKQVSKIKIWLMAIRPKTLFAAVSPILIALGYTIHAKLPLHYQSIIAIFIAALGLQIGSNLFNDYFDFKKGADTAERKGPTRVTQAGLLSSKHLLIGTIILYTIIGACGIYLLFRGGWPIFWIGIASVLSSILYTGGPFPYGYYGLGDFFVFIFFGPVAVMGTYYLQTFSFDYFLFYISIIPGLLSTAILVVNNTRDYLTDKKTNKITLVARFGQSFGRFEYLFTILIAFFIPVILVIYTKSFFGLLISLLILPYAIKLIITIFKKESNIEYNKLLASSAKLLFVTSLLVCIGFFI